MQKNKVMNKSQDKIKEIVANTNKAKLVFLSNDIIRKYYSNELLSLS